MVEEKNGLSRKLAPENAKNLLPEKQRVLFKPTWMELADVYAALADDKGNPEMRSNSRLSQK